MKIGAKDQKRLSEVLSQPKVFYNKIIVTASELTEGIRDFLMTFFKGAYDDDIKVERNKTAYLAPDGLALFFRYNFNAVSAREMIEITSECKIDSLCFNIIYDTSVITEELSALMAEAAERSGFTFVILSDRVTLNIKLSREEMLIVRSKDSKLVFNAFFSVFAQGLRPKPEYIG
ncbi:MAG: hypothetical protein IJY18_00655 [Clostridia bacterium]|nr:hypothetical protein [Clostridia bacterium]